MANVENQRIYNEGTVSDPSSIGVQFNTFFYQKKALIEAAREQYFGQMADVISMPKHMGKTIKRYHYLPLLDDANVNDQGLDVDGATTQFESTLQINGPDGAATAGAGIPIYFVGQHASVDATAILAAKAAFIIWVQYTYPAIYAALVDGTDTAIDYTELSTTGGASLYDIGYRFDLKTSVNGAGNLYGSSKDIGVISAKFPALSETGGRVNRVGFKRIELEGSIEKFGFFDEYTEESLNFDTDAELEMHINREMIMGANEITEDALQIDLLNAAGVIRYGGAATSRATVTGVDGAGAQSVPSYNDLMRLSIDLDNNRTPKKTKIITGSRMVDTRTIDAARPMYIGSELIPMVKEMYLPDGTTLAFVPVHQYGAATTIMRGEIGSIDQFRIIVVPEMMHWAGAGATATTNAGAYHTTDVAGTEKFDVFPMLVIGDASFTTIGFQTDGKTVKFKITHKKPGKDTADWNDPYGETGFMSIKWYYGTMILRPERIALIQCVAQF